MSWVLEEEQPLALDEIQGHILIGFGAAPQALGAFTAKDLKAAGRLVADWARLGRVTSSEHLHPRKGKPARKVIGADGPNPMVKSPLVQGPWVTLAVSHRLLRAVGVPSEFDDHWFKSTKGMPSIGELHDHAPLGGGEVGSDWVVGAPGRPVDVLIVVAAGVTSTAEELVDYFARSGGDWIAYSHRERLEPIKGSKEHFGFRDGISQPGVFGTFGGAPFEAERVSDDRDIPYALPGQELVWPGEFVFGYRHVRPGQPRAPGTLARPSDDATAAFAVNGSLLVYRRLTQNVAAFRAFCSERAGKLREGPFPEMTLEHLEALIVGRWRNGIPVARDPEADPEHPDIQNGFDFFRDDMDEGCPLSAHIRKVNPRSGGAEVSSVPRILRRGAPFGEPFIEGERLPAGRDRGLSFLSYQTSAEGQFGKLTANWMNDPSEPNRGGGHDLLVGQAGAGKERFFEIEGKPSRITDELSFWVRATGGAFLFTPSLTALKSLG